MPTRISTDVPVAADGDLASRRHWVILRAGTGTHLDVVPDRLVDCAAATPAHVLRVRGHARRGERGVCGGGGVGGNKKRDSGAKQPVHTYVMSAHASVLRCWARLW